MLLLYQVLTLLKNDSSLDSSVKDTKTITYYTSRYYYGLFTLSQYRNMDSFKAWVVSPKTKYVFDQKVFGDAKKLTEGFQRKLKMGS